MLTCSCVNTHDPQSAEITFLYTTVAVCILSSFDNCLFCYAEYSTTRAIVTFSFCQHFFMFSACCDASFNSSHFLILLKLTMRHHAVNCSHVRFINTTSRTQMTLTLGALLS